LNGELKKAIIGVIILFILVLTVVIFRFFQKPSELFRGDQKVSVERYTSRVTFLAFGDVNLGRNIGQRILKGRIDFPFEKIDLHEDSADIVFVNLESPLSDQNGETVSPTHNVIFTGPPEGSKTLKNAGITVVSTANNHLLDYGKRGVFETMDNLQRESILFVGTAKRKENLYDPLIIEKNNIKFAIFAVTAFVNFNPKGWKEVVAYSDTAQLLPRMKAVRESVDVIIVSYHGGGEYTERPIKPLREFADWCIANGADIFLGHHPHVTHGIEKKGRSIIVHSLGNFVFYQPQHYWTQRSYGVKFLFEKSDSSLSFDIQRIIPLKIGFQIERLTDSTENKKLFNRTQHLSNVDLSSMWAPIRN